MDPARYNCTLGLRLYQRLMDVDRTARLDNQQRLRHLIQNHQKKVLVFSSHDAIELKVAQERERRFMIQRKRKVEASGSVPYPNNLHL